MDDTVHETSWLRDEHRMILYAIVSLAVVVGGHRGWQEYHKYQEKALRRARILKLVENSKRENVASTSQNHLTLPVDDMKINMRSDATDGRDRSVGRTLPNGKADVGGPSTTNSAVTAGSNVKRSKERKKRGRDTLRDSAKQENNNNARTSSNSRSVGPGSGTGNQSQQQVAGPSGSSNTLANPASVSTESSRRGRQQNQTDSASRKRMDNTGRVEGEKHEDDVDTPRPNASSTMTSISARSEGSSRDGDRDADIDASDSFSSNHTNVIECAGTPNERGYDHAHDPEHENERNNDLLHPTKKHYTILPSQPPEVYNNYPRSRSKKRKVKDSASSLAGRSHFSTPSPSPSPSPSARLVPLPESRPGSSLGGVRERNDSLSSAGMRSRGSSIAEREFECREYPMDKRERGERIGREKDRDTEMFRCVPPRLTTSISTPHHPQSNSAQSESGMLSPSAMTSSSMFPHNLNLAFGQSLSMMPSMPIRENGHGNKGHKGEGGREKKQHLKSISSTSTSSSLAGSVSDVGSWDWDTGSSNLSANGAGNSNTNGSPTVNGQHGKTYPPPRFRSKTRQAISASPLPTLSSLANGVGSPHIVNSSKFNGNVSGNNSPETILFPTLNPTPPPNASLATQIASYKGALEAARMREESYRAEVDHFRGETERLSGEQDVIKWQWNEANKEWKRREAELQSHIHRLMHQLHGLSLVSSVTSGVTPPAHLPPNSMGTAVHPPMMPFVPVPPQVGALHNSNNNDHRSSHRTRSHHRQHHPQVYHSAAAVPGVLGSPFGYPSSAPASAPFYNTHYQMPTALTSMSMTGSGQIRRPGSTSTSRSSSNSASNSPSHHGVEVIQDNMYYDYQQENGRTANIEEEDDIGINEQLAEAILKRPESLRSPGSSSSIGSYTSGGARNGINGGGFSAWMINDAAKASTNGNGNGNGIGIVTESAMKNGLPSSSSVSVGSESDRTPVSGVQNGNRDEAFPNQDEREEDRQPNEDKENSRFNDIHENADKSIISIKDQTGHHNEEITGGYLLEDMDHSKQSINGNYDQIDEQKVDEAEYTSTQRE